MDPIHSTCPVFLHYFPLIDIPDMLPRMHGIIALIPDMTPMIPRNHDLPLTAGTDTTRTAGTDTTRRPGYLLAGFLLAGCLLADATIHTSADLHLFSGLSTGLLIFSRLKTFFLGSVQSKCLLILFLIFFITSSTFPIFDVFVLLSHLTICLILKV